MFLKFMARRWLGVYIFSGWPSQLILYFLRLLWNYIKKIYPVSGKVSQTLIG